MSNKMSNKPIEPTMEMLDKGVKEIKLCFPEFMGDDCEYDYDALCDAACFIWQAMYQAHVEK